MTLYLIKKDDFYFKNKTNGGNWATAVLEGCRFGSEKLAQNYIDTYLKDYNNCKAVTVEVTFKEKN